MEWSGSLTGSGHPLVGRYYIGETVVANQVMCWSELAGNGQVGDPNGVNTFTGALGVNLSGALTYSTTTGSGGVLAEVTYGPLDLVRGRASGTTASGGAHPTGTDGALMTQDSASATVLTEADVGTSDYVGGYQVGLTGVNKGHVRIVDSHSDNTSQTVNDPFDSVDSAGDTYIRVAAPFIRGCELTTDFVEFAANTATGGVNLPDAGELVIVDVEFGGRSLSSPGQAPNSGLRNKYAHIDSETNPSVHYVILWTEHAFGNVLS